MKVYSCITVCLLFVALFSLSAQKIPTPAQSSIAQMDAAFNGDYEWDATSGTLTFTKTGIINFTERTELTNNIWHIPSSVKKILINANVTITAEFTCGHNMTFEGVDQETSIVFGTSGKGVLNAAGLDKKYSCVAYSSFYGYHKGEIYIKNLTCLNPLGFMFTGKGGCKIHMDGVRGIDDRGGFSNHSDGISAAGGSTVKNCYFATGDDAIKVYANILVENTTIHMVKNCVPIQFTWGSYGSGAVGTFKNLTITGTSGRGSNNGIIVMDSDNAGGSNYKKTIIIEGCDIRNPNAELFRFDDNRINATVTITDAYIDIEQFGSNYGIGNITICDSKVKTNKYDCQSHVAIDNETVKSSLNVFPVPFTDALTLECNCNNFMCKVFNVQGKEMFSQLGINTKKIEINTADWAQGVYLLKTIEEDKIETVKVVKGN